ADGAQGRNGLLAPPLLPHLAVGVEFRRDHGPGTDAEPANRQRSIDIASEAEGALDVDLVDRGGDERTQSLLGRRQAQRLRQVPGVEYAYPVGLGIVAELPEVARLSRREHHQ